LLRTRADELLAAVNALEGFSVRAAVRLRVSNRRKARVRLRVTASWGWLVG